MCLNNLFLPDWFKEGAGKFVRRNKPWSFVFLNSVTSVVNFQQEYKRTFFNENRYSKDEKKIKIFLAMKFCFQIYFSFYSKYFCFFTYCSKVAYLDMPKKHQLILDEKIVSTSHEKVNFVKACPISVRSASFKHPKYFWFCTPPLNSSQPVLP